MNKSRLFIFVGSKNRFSHFIASRFMKGFGSYFNFQQRDLYKVLYFNIRLSYMTCTALRRKEKKLKKLKTKIFVNAKYYICSLHGSFLVPVEVWNLCFFGTDNS